MFLCAATLVATVDKHPKQDQDHTACAADQDLEQSCLQEWLFSDCRGVRCNANLSTFLCNFLGRFVVFHTVGISNDPADCSNRCRSCVIINVKPNQRCCIVEGRRLLRESGARLNSADVDCLSFVRDQHDVPDLLGIILGGNRLDDFACLDAGCATHLSFDVAS